MEYIRALYGLDKTLKEYLTQFALPIIIIGFTTMLLLLYLLPQALTGLAAYLVYLIPLYCLIFTLIYPFLVLEKKKNQINQNMHFLITHMGVLATTNISRKELFKLLSNKKEYKELAKECGRIYAMMDVWHMSLADACRFVARRTPSSIFADFLDRFAHSIESGEDLQRFLKNEQKVVMSDYGVAYRSVLYDIDVIKELITSIVISMIFFVCFAIIMPFLTGQDLIMLMALATFGFIVIEIIILYFIKSKMPEDRLWHSLPVKTPVDRKISKYLQLSIAGCILMGLIAFILLSFLPIAIKISITFTPLLIIGYVVKKEEELVKRRDDRYAVFIRSLATSADTRGGILEDALKFLSSHDFGILTKNIQDLYKRLVTRIDRFSSWRFFAADSGSNLIQRFSEMFIEALHRGGRPFSIGTIISNNFIELIALRKQRYQTTASLIGILYGLQAGLAFSLCISQGVVKMMNNIFTQIEIPKGIIGTLIFTAPTSLETISLMILAIIITHALISAIEIKIVDGGRILGCTTHFVIMLWIGSIVAIATEVILTSLLMTG